MSNDGGEFTGRRKEKAQKALNRLTATERWVYYVSACYIKENQLAPTVSKGMQTLLEWAFLSDQKEQLTAQGADNSTKFFPEKAVKILGRGKLPLDGAGLRKDFLQDINSVLSGRGYPTIPEGVGLVRFLDCKIALKYLIPEKRCSPLDAARRGRDANEVRPHFNEYVRRSEIERANEGLADLGIELQKQVPPGFEAASEKGTEGQSQGDPTPRSQKQEVPPRKRERSGVSLQTSPKAARPAQVQQPYQYCSVERPLQGSGESVNELGESNEPIAWYGGFNGERPPPEGARLPPFEPPLDVFQPLEPPIPTTAEVPPAQMRAKIKRSPSFYYQESVEMKEITVEYRYNHFAFKHRLGFQWRQYLKEFELRGDLTGGPGGSSFYPKVRARALETGFAPPHRGLDRFFGDYVLYEGRDASSRSPDITQAFMDAASRFKDEWKRGDRELYAILNYGVPGQELDPLSDLHVFRHDHALYFNQNAAVTVRECINTERYLFGGFSTHCPEYSLIRETANASAQARYIAGQFARRRYFDNQLRQYEFAETGKGAVITYELWKELLLSDEYLYRYAVECVGSRYIVNMSPDPIEGIGEVLPKESLLLAPGGPRQGHNLYGVCVMMAVEYAKAIIEGKRNRCEHHVFTNPLRHYEKPREAFEKKIRYLQGLQSRRLTPEEEKLRNIHQVGMFILSEEEETRAIQKWREEHLAIMRSGASTGSTKNVLSTNLEAVSGATAEMVEEAMLIQFFERSEEAETLRGLDRLQLKEWFARKCAEEGHILRTQREETVKAYIGPQYEQSANLRQNFGGNPPFVEPETDPKGVSEEELVDKQEHEELPYDHPKYDVELLEKDDGDNDSHDSDIDSSLASSGNASDADNEQNTDTAEEN